MKYRYRLECRACDTEEHFEPRDREHFESTAREFFYQHKDHAKSGDVWVHDETASQPEER